MNRAKEVLRFASVGLLSTATHALTYLALLTVTVPQIANLISFGLAFVLSYIGHSRFTFKNKSANIGTDGYQRLRFLIVALLGLSLNAVFVHFATNVLSLPDWSAVIFFVGVTPTTTYFLLHLWVFRKARPV